MCGEDVEESPSCLTAFKVGVAAADALAAAADALAAAALTGPVGEDALLRTDSRRCRSSSKPTTDSSSAISALQASKKSINQLTKIIPAWMC